MFQSNTYKKSSLITLISVFFFWGFVAASNTVLIGIFKKNFSLTQFQSQLVDFAFYAAYFSGSLVYFLVSITAGDPLNKIGYKKGLIYGLLLSAIGALGFVPAANLQSFPLMLGSLFTVGLGFALQQIVANPYVMAIGSPETGAHRVTLAGGINSFGTTIGPLLVSYAIFGNIAGGGPTDVTLSDVKLPYIVLSLAFVAFAAILGFSKLPPITNEEHLEKSIGALKFPQLRLGMLAIFAYVGVEVAIQSNLPALMELPEIKGLDHKLSVHFLSLYWGSLMIGRWTGALGAFNIKTGLKKMLMVVMPLLAYGVILLVNYIKGSPIDDFLPYFPYVVLLILGFFMGADKPARTLTLFGILAAVMMLLGLVSTGNLALYSFISGGLFCSIMWPCIFSLSLAGLGKYTNQGSSLLIMMILGGAIIPPFQGFLGDKLGMHLSYVVPVVCFAYLAFYGWYVSKVLKRQGISYDVQVENAH